MRIAITDVAYGEDACCAAAVLVDRWDAPEPASVRVLRLPPAAPYEPGHFWRRELPCLLAVLDGLGADLVVVDGYVWLDALGRRGLGAALHEALGLPVVGVAKTAFDGSAHAVPVLRGASVRPLFVTAGGVDAAEAGASVGSMAGADRLPRLVALADRLCREGLEPRFHPVVAMPRDAAVLDLSGPWPNDAPTWSIGRYDEVRGVYTQALFGGTRTLHVGVDLGGPAGTPVTAFAEGVVVYVGENKAHGDYGPTVVTRHTLDDRPVYALHGHLSRASLTRSPRGRRFGRGAVLGWLGEPGENGGWPPHLHFQLSWEDPGTHDMPGVVDPAEREAALARFPDPRRVLGPLW